MSSTKFYQAALATARRARKAHKAEIDAGNPENAVAMQEHVIDDFLKDHYLALQIVDRMTAMLPDGNRRGNNGKCDIFHVTISPRHDADWPSFREAVHKWAKGKVFEWVAYVFEQSGTSDETLGHNFHTHMVGHCGRAKSWLVQQAQQKFGKWAEPQCCDVKYAYEPGRLWQNYLVHHTSKDGHKDVTAEWDAKWREREHLAPAYGQADHPELEWSDE